ncbi:hypothetical protein PF005_g2842 [Phytophthora fragariae]|uniref:Uncharacterized protein n=1 Tax=Phytophthora fragariae TaxID=53985 RepID=A0A6A4EQU6_9STRA|nr:hypothetical protein PF003_g27196 [Phytophthora fragariae]KAE8947381.1 hypothetical protein PF009_g3027 [Phytophthora fragariae]KAE9134803.1 hypothetical protein PF007_g2797 [Phytophthora fragariae]KAE9153514.1 hypothetical protein PF006_g2360 [Phytophthora fragariae]KAE9232154.1 hypothetical protein PF005_g2842 [Phytophthora fragariae]
MDATECFVFDGKNDFGLWRERVESQLISRGLLGHVLVRGYNGTQSFTHNGKHIQPNARQALSDAEVLKEENEAVSCLRRFLHPTVETQIAKLNAYDRWATLKALYGCGGNAKINEMYRDLDRMKFGDTKAESIDRFTTRWEMTLQQFEQATGSEFSDSLKSAMLEDALPTSWRPLVAGWQGARPITPFNELLGNVLAEDKRSTTRPREERAKSRPTSPARVPSERTRQSDGAEKCYYCLRSNHSFRQCRYLQKDIEKGSTHNPRASYSCVVAQDRTPQMVEALEAFVAERTTHSAYGPPGDRKRGREDDDDRDGYERRSQSRSAFQRSQSTARRRSPSRGGRPALPQNGFRDDRAGRSHSVYRGDRAERSQSSFRDDGTDRSRSRSSMRGESNFCFPPQGRSFERGLGS